MFYGDGLVGIANLYPGPQRETFPGGMKVDTGPPNLIGPSKPYRGPYRYVIFCPMGVDLHLKVGG